MQFLRFLLYKLYSLIFVPRVMIDGTDNTITINKPLYQILMWMGIEKRNNIYMFRIINMQKDTSKYCFTILPKDMDASQTITRQLLYNTEYKTFGFEAACPTIQYILYERGLTHETKLYKVRTSLHFTKASIIYFSIDL